MRVVLGSIKHESMTFSPIPTTLDRFGVVTGEELIRAHCGSGTELGGFLDVTQREGVTVIPALEAIALPSGMVTREAIETLERRLLDTIEDANRAGGVDGVLLALHGAMVTEVTDDAEGHILRRVREIIGPQVPLVSTLDWHCYLSEEMMQAADALVTYDTWPHVDMRERGVEAAEILLRIARGEVQPAAARCHPPMLIAGPTAFNEQPPMKTVLDRAHEIERDPRVITVTIAPGYAFTDIPGAGTYTYVLTNGDRRLAQQYADELGQMLWNLRHDFVPKLVSPEEAVGRALSAPKGPVLLIDQGDVPSGGASGDGTTLLRLLIEAGASSAAAVIADGAAAQEAIAAGIGSLLRLSIGGKIDNLHGSPVEVDVVVRTITDGKLRLTGPIMAGMQANLGPTAVVSAGGVDIVLTTARFATVDRALFTSQGIEPAEKQVLLIKSSFQYHAAFAPIAAEIIDVDTPGLTTPVVSHLPYTRLTRPIFPLDDVSWSP